MGTGAVLWTTMLSADSAFLPDEKQRGGGDEQCNFHSNLWVAEMVKLHPGDSFIPPFYDALSWQLYLN